MTQGKFIKIVLLLAILAAINVDLFAQLKKANSYFQQGMYHDAILYYNKVIKKDSANIGATENIAFAYRKLKDYSNAERYYAQAVQMNPSESANYLYYGQVLRNNNKITAAKNQFRKFAAQNPNSFVGKLMIQSCDDTREWETEKKEFIVSEVENINTKNSEFCPLMYEDGIVFVSDRGFDLVNENNDQVSSKPYLSIYFAKKSKQFRKAKHISSQLNTLYHDGPISISSNQKMIYFTRVKKKEQGKSYTNRLKIYSAKLEEGKWKNITALSLNNEDYSIGHPCISENGKKLFFASDMPGGYGGMDIYVSIKNGEEWRTPVNLGKGVNTPENEVFPYFRKGALYFSSDGHSGYGGLDIYSALESDQWIESKNLKAPLNSAKDDFGIFYKDDENGYFSSNRDGGVGSDDIYSFVWRTLTPQTEISGLIEYQKLAAAGTKISLINEDDVIVKTIMTDEKGRFKFSKLDLDKSYLLTIDEKDDSFLEKSSLYITNSNGQKVLLANRIGKRKFTFKTLPTAHYDGLELMEEKDESLFTVDVYGQVYEKLPGDYSGGMAVWVVDDEGNIIGKTFANSNGKFKFEKLSPDETYLFKLSEDDVDLNLIIVDENGHVIESANRLANGRYRYVRLDSEESVLTLINEVDVVIKIAENENFIISKILYEFGSAEINEIAASELDKIVLILQKNKDIGVELSSHTDSKGTDQENMKLSQERASLAAKYVVSKGIDRSKIVAKGYGETIPVAPNALSNGKDNPEGRAKNRRTEFKVIKLK